MSKVLVTPLRRIETPGGDVLHGIRASDPGFAHFGEAYFSVVEKRFVKGWKRHRRMTLNFIVACGSVKVWIHDQDDGETEDFLIGVDLGSLYARLTIPPGLWVAFGGVGAGLNLILNVASIEHEPEESDRLPLDAFHWVW